MQKRSSKSVITRLTHLYPAKTPWSFPIINRGTYDYISRLARVQGLVSLRQPYKDAGLEFGGKASDKASLRNRPTSGPWVWEMQNAAEQLVDQSMGWMTFIRS